MTPADELAAVVATLGGRGQVGRPLGPLTTYRVGGPAACFVEAADEADLLALRAALAGWSVPVLVVGKGSNLLVSEAGFAGVAVTLGAGLAGIEIGPGGRLRAGAAAGLPVVARRSVEAGLTGFEWAVGVPGSVGGAVAMNAGGHGSDMAACLARYGWLDLAGAGGGEDGPARLALSYRHSSLAASDVVLWAELALAPGDRETGRRALADIVRWRREHQPGGSNAGSVFTNPPGDSAGRLIDAAGLSGLRIGSAVVSTKHANFFQADDGGSADDVYALICHVRAAVAERFGVTLTPEVHLVGFERADPAAAGPSARGLEAGAG
jgi:UDP-N-acetylmuramate dehydrogenase